MALSHVDAVFGPSSPLYADVYAHPATYNPAILDAFAEILERKCARYVLDPFAGTGKIHRLRRRLPDLQTVGVELEAEWSSMSIYNILGNALRLPSWWTGRFDAIATSPTFGNRMGDHFVDRQPEKGYRRNTYTHTLGRQLHPENSGKLQWGSTHKTRLQYCEFHYTAWREAWRVLQNEGWLIVEIKDHIRAGKRQRVTLWHIECLKAIGFRLREHRRLPVSGNRQGQNGESRIPYTSILVFQKVTNL